MSDNFTLSITVLLTGFAVVFTVLLILIGLIKFYGTLVYRILSKRFEQKAARNAGLPKVEREPEPEVIAEVEEPVADDDELIAVITAAVYSMYSSEVRVKSIRKVSPRGSAWRNAGLTENVRPF